MPHHKGCDPDKGDHREKPEDLPLLNYLRQQYKASEEGKHRDRGSRIRIVGIDPVIEKKGNEHKEEEYLQDLFLKVQIKKISLHPIGIRRKFLAFIN